VGHTAKRPLVSTTWVKRPSPPKLYSLRPSAGVRRWARMDLLKRFDGFQKSQGYAQVRTLSGATGASSLMSSEREEKWVGHRARFISRAPPRRPPLTFSRLPRTPCPRPARASPPPPRSVHRRGPAHADPLHQRGRLLAAHRGREPHPRRHVAGRARVRHHARYRVPVPAVQGCVCRAEEGAPRGLLRARKPSALVSPLSLPPTSHTRVVPLSPVPFPPPLPSQTLASGRRTPRGSRTRRAGSGSPRPCGCPPAPSSRRRLGRIRGRRPRRGAGCLGLCGCARWLACSTSPRRAR
jgi:hypothetical protein